MILSKYIFNIILNMQSIDFNTYDHNFCESSIYSSDPHPEYLNALSSLFTTFIGINGLFKPHLSFYLILLYSSLIVNGITSCLYHYYNTIGFGLLDRMSMIIIAINSVNLFTPSINKIIIIDKWKYINLIYISIIILCTSYFTLLFTIAGLHMETLFNIMFGLFLGSLLIFIYLFKKHYYKLEIPYELIVLGQKGIVYITLSGLFWIITEHMCHYSDYIKYLFGHVWWHLFVSYGGYLISLIPNYIDLNKHQRLSENKIKLVYDNFNIPYLIYDKNNISV